MALAHELIPLVRVAAQDPLVGEEDGDTGGVEVVAHDVEGLLEVAQGHVGLTPPRP